MTQRNPSDRFGFMHYIGEDSRKYIRIYWCPLKIFGGFRDFYFLGQPIYWTHK